jgi:hypothetical protein
VSSPAVSLEAIAELLLELRSAVAALRAESSDVLDVPAVSARYGLRDPRAARAIMRETGGAFTVARRLLIHRAVLEAWELEQATAEADGPVEPTASRRASRRAPARLPTDFWKAGRGSA